MIDEILKYNKKFVESKEYEKFETSKYPDKKIASVKHKSVMKRFNEMRFAAGANRDYMEVIEFTGLSLDDLIDVALEEMGAISDVLGL